VKNTQKISQAEMILLTIYRLSKTLENRVPFEEIVIQVWKDCEYFKEGKQNSL